MGDFSPMALAAFESVFRPWMRRHIHAVRIAGLPGALPPQQPLLLVANHCSWWDAFALREAQRVLRPGAPVHTVMLRSELRRFPFFRWLGAVGIEPGSPGSVAHAVRGLQARLRARPDAVVLFFPQGRIWPSFRRPLGFQRGVELLARRLAPVTTLPVGLHLEPLVSPAPSILVSVGEPLDGPAAADAGGLEAAVAEQLDRIFAFLVRHGEQALLAWPAPHQPLPPAAREEAPPAEVAG